MESTSNDELRSGEEFSNFVDLKDKLTRYEAKHRVQWFIRDSKIVKAANKSLTESAEKYPEKFVYRFMCWQCKQSGDIRTTGAGSRPKQR